MGIAPELDLTSIVRSVRQARDQVRDARIALALRRDEHLTEAELIAVLEVRAEFGQ
jgi:hypothetical protein